MTAAKTRTGRTRLTSSMPHPVATTLNILGTDTVRLSGSVGLGLVGGKADSGIDIAINEIRISKGYGASPNGLWQEKHPQNNFVDGRGYSYRR